VRKLLKHSGFTLTEVLVAVVVFSVGLLGIAGLATVIIRGNTFSSMLTTATILAQDKLEESQDTAYTAINTGRDSVTGNNIIYTRVWNVTDNAPAAGMKTIEVTVSWRVRGKQQHQVVLKTIVTDT
jgi:type IV pilus assembly protein PilV